MKALVLTTAKKAANVQEWPQPTPKGNEILVKVHSVALNPVDASYVARPIALQAQRVVGSDFAGEVVGLSPELDDVSDVRAKIGARVAGLLQGGERILYAKAARVARWRCKVEAHIG
jgi:NADPH:quinone reductase-like Zn-dependent oxidoreductase